MQAGSGGHIGRVEKQKEKATNLTNVPIFLDNLTKWLDVFHDNSRLRLGKLEKIVNLQHLHFFQVGTIKHHQENL